MTERPGRLVLLGHPVAHSLSPTFQNAALRAAGIPLTYEAIDTPADRLAATVAELVAGGAAGNVTIPHKRAVRALCDVLTPLAARVGAVNTFWTAAGRLYGDNTDVTAFAAVVERLLGAPPRGIRVAVLGAGGAAAAVLAAVDAWEGCHTVVWSRTPEPPAALAARFEHAEAGASLTEAIRGAALVVNATPIGLATDDVPVDPGLLRRRTVVVDLVYRRGETPWVRLAKRRGLRAIDGLPILVEQGALAFERWFGFAPERDAMWQALR